MAKKGDIRQLWQEHLEYIEDNLEQIVALIPRHDLSNCQRKLLIGLITADVHCRDIVEQLKQSAVDSVSDFTW